MKHKHNISFISNVYKVEKKIIVESKNKIFCKCGNSFEFNMVYNGDGFEPVACNSCGKIYSNFKELCQLGGYRNKKVIFSRFRVYENENNITLYRYDLSAIVGLHSKKIIYKDSKSYIVFNKKRKCIYYKSGGGKFYSIALRGLIKVGFFISYPSDIFNDPSLSYYNDKIQDCITNPLDDFLNKILNFANQSDFNKIANYITLETDQTSYFTNIQDRDLNIIANKILAAISISSFPPIATIYNMKGSNFVFNLLNQGYLPALRFIKKNNPTTPLKIINQIIRAVIETNSINRRATIKESIKNGVVDSSLFVFDADNKRFFNIGMPTAGDKKTISHIKINKKTFNKIEQPFQLEIILKYLTVVLNQSDEDFMNKKPMQFEDFNTLIEKYGFDGFRTIVEFKSLNRDWLSYEFFNDTHLKHILNLKLEKDKSIDLFMYHDTLRLLHQTGRNLEEIKKLKSVASVKEMHDNLSIEAQKIKNEKYDEMIKNNMQEYTHLNCDIDGVSFEVLDSVQSLNNESAIMSHCVRTYAESVSMAKVIIFRIEDKVEKTRSTMSIRVNDDEFKFEQLKGRFNSKSTIRIIKNCIVFLNKIKADFTDSTHDLTLPTEEENPKLIEINKNIEILEEV
jgi:hypothetical protein